MSTHAAGEFIRMKVQGSISCTDFFIQNLAIELTFHCLSPWHRERTKAKRSNVKAEPFALLSHMDEGRLV